MLTGAASVSLPVKVKATTRISHGDLTGRVMYRDFFEHSNLQQHLSHNTSDENGDQDNKSPLLEITDTCT